MQERKNAEECIELEARFGLGLARPTLYIHRVGKIQNNDTIVEPIHNEITTCTTECSSQWLIDLKST